MRSAGDVAHVVDRYRQQLHQLDLSWPGPAAAAAAAAAATDAIAELVATGYKPI